jgi:hypothetical protein
MQKPPVQETGKEEEGNGVCMGYDVVMHGRGRRNPESP